MESTNVGRNFGQMRIACVLLMLCLAFGACAGNDGSAGDGSAGRVDSTRDSGVSTSDPPRANESAAATFYDLEVLEEELIETCMEREGFEYVPKEIDPELQNYPLLGEFEFGITNFEKSLYDARKRGYDIAAPWLDIAAGEGGTPEIVAGTGEEQRAREVALFGSELPGGGCATEAREATWGQRDPEPGSEEDRLRFEVLNRISQDQRVRDAREAWHGCMAGRGFETQPGLPQVDLAVELAEIIDFEAAISMTEDELRVVLQGLGTLEALEELQAREINTAVADVECERPIIDLENEILSEVMNE